VSASRWRRSSRSACGISMRNGRISCVVVMGTTLGLIAEDFLPQ
jgi:hypothetical protein